VRLDLRRAHVDDIEQIASIEAQIEPGAWTADALRRQLVADTAASLVATDRSDVVGHVLTTVAADEAEVLTLAVAPARRRGGAGAALMHAVMIEWGSRGVRQAFLEVRVDNRPARALYEALGFREVGRRRAYYGDGTDALVMRLDLNG
jgi:ribosomal-protein-alanine N-acetyltransferase